MSSLADSYENHYRDQSEESVERLFLDLVEYDFSDYFGDVEKIADLRGMHQCSGRGSVTLHSNGSTGGESRRYEFSPHFHAWAGRIEPFLRNIHEGKTIFLYCRVGNGTPPGKFFISEVTNNKKHYETNANFLDDSQLDGLFEFVDRLYEDAGKVNFSSFPDIWNMLLSNPKFNHMCLERKEKIGCLVNSDFGMLFGTDEFWLRDQMINWSSGLNFYTCRHGTRHFLPTFFESEGCLGLINMKAEKDRSDEIKLGEAKFCECGMRHVPIEISFHAKNTILGADGRPMDFSSLGRSLKGRYATIQFHQNHEEEVTVFMTPVGKVGDDTDRIKSFFSGMKTEFVLNRYFEVGSKRYCFWRSRAVDSKEFKLN